MKIEIAWFSHFLDVEFTFELFSLLIIITSFFACSFIVLLGLQRKPVQFLHSGLVPRTRRERAMRRHSDERMLDVMMVMID